MKNYLLVALCFIFATAGNAQKNDKNFELGVNSFQAGDYKQAVVYFSASIERYPATNAIVNRAICYYYLGDTCKFCNELKMASGQGDAKAKDLYQQNCTRTMLRPKVPDTIKKQASEAQHLQVIYHRCHDSVVNIVFSDGKKTWSRELTEFMHESNDVTNATKDIEGEIFTIVENMPEFPGGNMALEAFLAKNIVYPDKAVKYDIQGIVYVSFVIDKEGYVRNVKILRGIGGGCDEEAVRVVKLMPKWKPGTQNGKPVNVLFNMPFTYSLSNSKKSGARK